MANIRERAKKDGTRYYEFTAYLGEKDGKQLRKFKYWTPPLTQTGKIMTEKAARTEAERLAARWEEDLLGGNYVDTVITLSELFEKWSSQHLPNLAPKTAQEYRKQWKRLEPLLGFLKSDKVSVKHINAMYAEFQQEGANLKTGGKKSVEHYHRMLSSMFNWAIRSEYMTKNPCENATKPKHEKKPKVVFDFEQGQILLRNLGGEPLEFQAQLGILIMGGIRRGELFAIRWSDLLDGGILRVQRAVSYIEGEGLIIKRTKTGDIRNIKLTERFLQTLEEYRLEQQEKIEKLGDLFTDQGYMFASDTGTPRHPDCLSKKYKAFLRKCGFSEEIIKAIPLKGLRDTFASFLFASGADVRTVAGLMGHSQPTMTLNVYAQFLPSQCGVAAAMFDEMMGG